MFDDPHSNVANFISNKNINADVKKIFKNLIQLNPYLRWSPQECLKMKFFDEIRNDAIENFKC